MSRAMVNVVMVSLLALGLARPGHGAPAADQEPQRVQVRLIVTGVH